MSVGGDANPDGVRPQSGGRIGVAVKDIRIDALAVGMFVVRLDRPWPQDSNFASLHRIRGQRDITWLKAYGVRVVTIDPTLGGDVADEPLPDLPPAPVPLAGELEGVRREPPASRARFVRRGAFGVLNHGGLRPPGSRA